MYIYYYVSISDNVLYVDTVDLVQSIIVSSVGNGVEALADNGYRVSRPLSRPTTDSSWSAIASSDRLAVYARINSNYTGRVLQWNNNVIDVNVITESSSSSDRLLSVQFNDSPSIKFRLPTADDSALQTVAFTLRGGASLSVYSDCTLIHTANIPHPLTITDPTGGVNILGNTSSSQPAIVSTIILRKYIRIIYSLCNKL